jgi:hypothetical protein
MAEHEHNPRSLPFVAAAVATASTLNSRDGKDQ